MRQPALETVLLTRSHDAESMHTSSVQATMYVCEGGLQGTDAPLSGVIRGPTANIEKGSTNSMMPTTLRTTVSRRENDKDEFCKNASEVIGSALSTLYITDNRCSDYISISISIYIYIYVCTFLRFSSWKM